MNTIWMGLSRLDQTHSHENCIHYEEGFCTLNHVSVDPNGAVCPRFMPKNVTEAARNETPFQQSIPPIQTPPPQMVQSSFPVRQMNSLRAGGMGRMRRGRRGRGRNR